MPKGLELLRPGDLTGDLEQTLLPKLASLVREREKGHCMRLSDLDADLMRRLCAELRKQVPEAQVYVLGAAGPGDDPALFASSTKLVELRNPAPDGSLRPPLLVFLPTNLRASAEDSFGVATFEEVSLRDVYAEIAARLRGLIPSPLRTQVGDVLDYLRQEKWPWWNALAEVRYLRTVVKNGSDPEAAGAAVFEVGLVPDFELFAKPAEVLGRVRRNRESVDRLTRSDRSERGRVLELGLENVELRARLGEFFIREGLENPRSWTHRIVANPDNWAYSFDKWAFKDPKATQNVCVEVIETTLPKVGPDKANEATLRDLVGQPYLPIGPKGLSAFEVSFRVKPHPSEVGGLAQFEVQIVSEERGAVAGARKVKKSWKTRGNEAKVIFNKLNRLGLEEGWHFVRVRALTDDGDFFPLVDRDGRPVAQPDGEEETRSRRVNESDLFFVLPEGEAEDTTAPAKAVPEEPTFEHARLHLEFEALREGRSPGEVTFAGATWITPDQEPRTRSAESRVEARFGSGDAVQLPVPAMLRELEDRISGSESQAVSVRLTVRDGKPDTPTSEALALSGAAAEAFLHTRQEFLRQVRGKDKLPLLAADYRGIRQTVLDYAGAYRSLVLHLLQRVETSSGAAQAQALGELARALAIDSVTLILTGRQRGVRQAILLGPGHPLRALWLAAWAELGRWWVGQLAAMDSKVRERYLVTTRDTLMQDLTPLHFPFAVPLREGQLFCAVDHLHPYWTLYAPTGEPDLRGLVGEVCAALGLAEPAAEDSRVNGKFLAGRVRRYLAQHPYIHTLTLNVFYPGGGRLVADLLSQLLGDRDLAGLRYDIRLFARDPAARGLGEALDRFLSPFGTGVSAGADGPLAGNHLYPRVALAVQDIQSFRERPADFPAHLSLLFDVFPSEELGASGPIGTAIGGTVFGLFQEFRTDYRDDSDGVCWRRQPGQTAPPSFPPAPDLGALLGELPGVLSEAATTLATGRRVVGVRPVASLTLGADERAFLHQVHEVSDWVFSLDRNLGIEFFDHGGRPDRPDYLLDHTPEMTSAVGRRLVITSRSLVELGAIFRPVLQDYGLPFNDVHAFALLQHLRSLSGRLALKLASAPTQRAEALGLALARIYLGRQGAFRNQLVMPLDSHLELYVHLDWSVVLASSEVSFKRTDLALVDLNLAERLITVSLVEVKCLRQVGEAQAWRQLRENITRQIGQSEEVLRYHFDPQLAQPDRPDRPFKTRQFARLLEYYLARSQRYGLIADEALADAREFLATIDQGYKLQFRRSAIVFDFDKPGTEPADQEGGVEYHRIGADLIPALVEASAAATSVSQAEPTADEPPTAPRPPASEGGGTASIPVLTEAAFLVPARPRPGQALRTSEEQPDDDPRGTKGDSPAPHTAPPPVVDEMVPGQEAVPDPARGPEVGRPAPPTDGQPRSVLAADRQPTALPPVPCDVWLGTTSPSVQFGILGDVAGRKVALDLNHTQTISLFGVQGGGKSYTLGTIVEMACLPIEWISQLPRPLASVIFHYSATQDYRPEFTSMIEANTDPGQVRLLAERYGATPMALSDVLLLVPRDKVGLRKSEYPGLDVRPLVFSPGEIQASHWRFLMGAVGSQSLYLRQVNAVMRSIRGGITLNGLRQGIEQSSLPDHLRQLAMTRLDLAAQYLDEGVEVRGLLRPGRLVIVDLRDEFIEKDEALGLFVVLLQLFADARDEDGPFNKLVVFDEAHKYIENQELITGLVEVVREMRHKGVSILVASQDPPSVPVQLIELSTQIILHKFNSPAWLKHVQRANAALSNLTPEMMAQLAQGEAYIWSSKATDNSFSTGAVKVRCRPRVTRHGGETKTAVK